MVTIYKLNKLTAKQLEEVRETVEATKGSRCKVEAFAQAVSKLATKPVDQPKVGSMIARIHEYNLGSSRHPDRRLAYVTCGRFIKWGWNNDSVITTDHQTGIFAGRIISLTDAAMHQLGDEYEKLVGGN
mgnify:CR=1 FL=1